ncbi:hypothetical protein O3M35_011398 [Rhynocoris fuscipes]|uniref:oleoyl-[acyl-carrier-protein] hydrolase n=1 Tax=Rhynocoris fuscipes TaxID=488301 RepID=A0AAW1CW49_9HEMI
MKEFTSNNKNLFMIHSIEGFTFFLNEIASHLNCNVWGIQCAEDAPLITIEQLATHYLKEVHRIQAKGPYYILGYSYGATIALEMVKQLEEQNEQCELIMVDSSPDYTKGWINSYIDKYTSDSEKHAVLLAYFSASLKGNTTIYRQILKEIINEKDIKSQLIKCAEKFHFINDLSKNEFITAASSFYKKVITALNYHPNFKLKSNITFIKAEHNFIKAENDDYGLQKVIYHFSYLIIDLIKYQLNN